MKYAEVGLCLCLQHTVALIQLVVGLVGVNHLCSNSQELQEPILRDSVLFLEAADHVHAEFTQVCTSP